MFLHLEYKKNRYDKNDIPAKVCCHNYNVLMNPPAKSSANAGDNSAGSQELNDISKLAKLLCCFKYLFIYVSV